TTATVLPSRRRPHASASMEPRQSGSGSTWDVMTNDSWRSIACASRSSPSGPAIAILLAGAGGFRLDADLGRRVRAAGKRAQQPVDAVAPFNGIVELKGDLRRVPQADALAQLRANVALRVRQRRQRLLFLLLVAEDADENLGVAQGTRQYHVGHGHDPDPGVLHLAQNVARLPLQVFPDPLCTGDRH